MKQLLSIFFLSIFFLFQYGKMIDYMECRIAAAVASVEDCGCDEKLISNSTTEDASLPFHQHHLKNYTEEFFTEVHVAEPAAFSTTATAHNRISSPQLLAGFTNQLLQPPNS
ncbi:hypothetical protein ESA94_14005 [Lacibacter luteus]|uniref:Uncharacterized protein n=1 Tax=Lacibacter luteus TaxID=2508719 RepID=A0A4Q1CH76_9BACT|nr:hypothetical protein [Lacibacter luteus]RXK59251.1 hypothetical protein ESA94_14005 [Lacibacter luteus]